MTKQVLSSTQITIPGKQEISMPTHCVPLLFTGQLQITQGPVELKAALPNYLDRNQKIILEQDQEVGEITL